VVRQLARFAPRRVDVCIDLEFFSKFSTLMSVLSGAPIRVAFHLNSFWRYSVVTRPVYYNYYRHVSDVYGDAAATVGAKVIDKQPCRLAVEPASAQRCREQLRAAGWNGADRLVGVNVNAGELSLERRWPGERFATVLERLCAADGVRAVMTGASEEADYVAEVVALLSEPAKRRVINMAGRFYVQRVRREHGSILLLSNERLRACACGVRARGRHDQSLGRRASQLLWPARRKLQHVLPALSMQPMSVHVHQ
jgi:ADP-heptose:LPS heptosyltransferase